MQSQEKLALFSNPTFVHRHQCQCTSSPVGSSPSSSPRGPPPSLTSSPSPCSSSWWMVTLNYTVCNHFEREPGFDTGSKKTSILLLLLKSYWSSPLMINITHINNKNDKDKAISWQQKGHQLLHDSTSTAMYCLVPHPIYCWKSYGGLV